MSSPALLGLQMFPVSGFDTSVITPVLLGVLITWMLTETFGWVFAGLVVPGYLAAVFLVEPMSGVVNVVEAVITYLVARAIGEYLPKTHLSSRVFGRERFFLVTVVSILVRIICEGFILQRALPESNSIFSIGLVVVPLTAHSMWKIGLLRGVVQKGVPTLLVYLLLQYVLIPNTNLSLQGFALANENLVLGFLDSPKPYIILLTGAILAAIANLKYGWDFNGILVPALLGLVVLWPSRFVATFAEALVLVGVVALLFRFTPLGRANVEGPRRVVLFFVVDYLLRFVFASLLGASLPGDDIAEMMGFGYLIATLLAVKVSQKQSAALVLIPTAMVSGLGFAGGTLIGALAERLWRTPVALADEPGRLDSGPPRGAPEAAFWVGMQSLLEAANSRPMLGVSPRDLANAATAALHGDSQAGRNLGLTCQEIDGNTYLIYEAASEPEERRGFPAMLVRRGTHSNRVVVAPAPLDDPHAALAAGYLVQEGLAKAALISQMRSSGAGGEDARLHSIAKLLAGDDEVVTVRVPLEPKSTTEAHAGPLSQELLRRKLDFSLAQGPTSGSELKLGLGALGQILVPQPEKADLSSAASVSLLLSETEPQRAQKTYRHDLAVRRALLEPLLSENPKPHFQALLPFAARTLGYRLFAGDSVLGGSKGWLLLPTGGESSLAVLARQSSARTPVVEVPYAYRAEVRDVALRMAQASSADSSVFNFRFQGAYRRDELRAAHSTVTLSGRPVIAIRGALGPEEAGVSYWGPKEELQQLVDRSLARLGLELTQVPPSVAWADLLAHTASSQHRLALFTFTADQLAHASLRNMRLAMKALDVLSVPVLDGSVTDAAAKLERALPTQGTLAHPAFLVDAVTRATSERSRAGARELAQLFEGHVVRAALVQTPQGPRLAVLARANDALVLVAAPTEPLDFPTEVVHSTALSACKLRDELGVCEVRP